MGGFTMKKLTKMVNEDNRINGAEYLAWCSGECRWECENGSGPQSSMWSDLEA